MLSHLVRWVFLSMIALILPRQNRFDVENHGINLGPAGDLTRETFAEYGINSDDPNQVFVTFADAFFTGTDSPPSNIEKFIFTGVNTLKYISKESKNLDALRGVIMLAASGKPYIITYWPQDCVDVKDIESDLDEGDTEDDGDVKGTSPTKRVNYRFWFKQDVKKLLTHKGAVVKSEPQSINASTSNEACRVFDTKGPIFLDIETHPKTNTLSCLAVACGDGPIYSIPVYDWNGILRVGAPFFTRFIREVKKRKVVVHNALFDLLFLAAFYKIPFGTDIYDTMVAGHRIWPEAEKSLAHQATLYTNRPFHKDEGGNFDPRSHTQYEKLRAYNVKDVVVLREIYYGQIKTAEQDPGLKASVEQASSSIYDYAFMSLHGLPFNVLKRSEIVKRAEKRLNDLQRVLNILVGEKINASSPDQVVNYLHNKLKYRPEKTTLQGSPSVAGDALYKIKIKHPKNITIDVIIEMRRMMKIKGMLGFEQWVWRY